MSKKYIILIIASGVLLFAGVGVWAYYNFFNDVDTVTCTYGGEEYESGDSFDSEDGCNTCICAEGKVACTKMACPEDDAEEIFALSEKDLIQINMTVIQAK